MDTNKQKLRRRFGFLNQFPTLIPGIVFLLIIILPALVGRYFVDLDMSRVLAAAPNLPPSQEHLLGTQSEGRDVVTLLIIGTPITLKIGFIGGAVALFIGSFLGLIAGYYGGILDTLTRSAVDIGLTIPTMAILVMIAASFPVVTPTMMGLVVALVSWMHPTRVIRSQVLSLRERNFVFLAKLSGAGNFYIIFRELMPNLIPFLAASFVNAVSTAILATIGLEVLGLGSIQSLSLGSSIYYAIYYAAMWRGLWWWWLPPIVILIILFLGMFLVSVALDKYANPRIQRA